ncbi:MAG: dihydrolipoyl dehydrogenase [Dehalococcoidia bacterium]|nr:dihydrolipoyl dehydrogenase [Dehalococcoidia bacterium]
MAETYDVAVIGAGPGGYIAAIRAAQLGMRTAVIERGALGGVCLNIGCIPSKALLRNAEVVNLARHGETFGITYRDVQFDMGKAVDRSRAVVERMVKGVAFLLRKHKIEVIAGQARLTAPGKIAIDTSGQQVSARNIIIATGARNRDLPSLAADGKAVITSTEALALRTPPRHIAIIGGGAVGVEFAYYFRAYGSEVTVVELLPRLVPQEDEEVSRHLERALAKQGIAVRTGAGVTGAEHAGGRVRLALSAGEPVECDTVLLGVGVRPNSEGLGLEALGVAMERGNIVINERMATNVPGLCAIGDVTGKLLLAHVASAQGVAAVEGIAGLAPRALRYEDMPRATYCQPQAASIGLTEAQARERGYEIKTSKAALMASGKAVALGETDGFVKIVADAKTGEVLGAHMLGHDVSELLGEVAVTRLLEGTALELGRAVHPHPTISESLMEAGLGIYGESLNV